jgi:Tfp pilus assembly ATPase PilU
VSATCDSTWWLCVDALKAWVKLMKSINIRELGMQTFDQALFDLYKAGEVTYKDALKHADSPNDLRLTIKLSEEGAEQLLNASKNITFDGQ